ncbi:uracil-DNA glycosylase [Rhizobium sp. TRM96647]|uniref:uracil-DNA glycosylase n=1 Tax=unclassified Rhizobium TaxID=2613769 RepID=UPI0021E91344|nr:MULTISPECIES: uracil-DNA glycosylase [unclassified Rhizobium]MCV3738580.1 uracil-DNA glycosylase [Rhizobium sp. TRM96647]MCV3760267.1 uracil-DNA glycosylase [Rhizobium sp. TRM96650]
MISAADLQAAELAALLAFHADAGVEWLLEDWPVDRIAEFEAMRAAHAARQGQRQDQGGGDAAARNTEGRQAPSGSAGTRNAARAAPREIAAPAVAMPDGQAVAEASAAAAGAATLDELRAAMERFGGCNLKNSARGLVFAQGNPQPPIMVIGPMPNADDDREGLPFSGRQGAMLDRMLAGIGLVRTDVLLSNVIPWRPPGNRVPSAPESDICRPFIERQIALAAPNHLLILGNFAARFFFGGTQTIHQMRGEWRQVEIGGRKIAALATLHPQDLVAAPVSKRLAWQDLLAFRAGLAAAAERID